MIYTQAELDDLISVPKVVIEPPRKVWEEERAHLKNAMRLESQDGSKRFEVYMRKHRDFNENFSIGLDYLPRDEAKRLSLLRCNGAHGQYNQGDSGHPHFEFHIHNCDAELIDAGRDPLAMASKTTEYASYEEAIRLFCRIIHLQDVESHFPTDLQSDLFSDASSEGTE